jgi:predicted DNA-binding WGR domain protein
MTAIMLTRKDGRRNMRSLLQTRCPADFICRMVFGPRVGRIGRAGTVRREVHTTRGLADLALISKWAEKHRRGYR